MVGLQHQRMLYPQIGILDKLSPERISGFERWNWVKVRDPVVGSIYVLGKRIDCCCLGKKRKLGECFFVDFLTIKKCFILVRLLKWLWLLNRWARSLNFLFLYIYIL